MRAIREGIRIGEILGEREELNVITPKDVVKKIKKSRAYGGAHGPPGGTGTCMQHPHNFTDFYPVFIVILLPKLLTLGGTIY